MNNSPMTNMFGIIITGRLVSKDCDKWVWL